MAKKKPKKRKAKRHEFGVLHIPKDVKVRDTSIVDGGARADPEQESWATWEDRGKRTPIRAKDSSP